jgi:predicted 2-oxoglutarate/Fe(II)-dependent dioxygenase YbiX
MDADLPATAWSPPFGPGDPAPWFTAATPANPQFHFSTCVGRYMLLGFLPGPSPARDAAFSAFQAHRALFNDKKLAAFMVLRDAGSIAKARDQPPGLRWFLDADGAVSRLYGALGDPQGGAVGDDAEHPYWLLLDPSHRVLDRFEIADAEGLFKALKGLPEVADYAGAELFAPVLIVPRVFDPDLCKRLIAIYEADGGSPSGVMRDVGGRTVGVLDNFKRRRDVPIADKSLQVELLARIERALMPEVAKVFQFRATRLERYMVACYDAAEGGYFRPHRDNETLGTAHRRFACSINLNAEDFEGGDLRFPEFGPRTYRPPTGGAVIFSCSLQHEATPVTRGRRYAFLPFFYDEAGRAIREANADFLADPRAQALAKPGS